MKDDKVNFTDEIIQKLFGHEAAEDEDFNRLKEYYFKIKVYDRIIADLPLRILVGHKGIGKSALFKVAISEEKEAGHLPILIRPDDILGLKADTSDFLQTIRDWKQGLNIIIGKKVLTSLGVESKTDINKIKKYSGRILNLILDTINSDKLPINLDAAKRELIDNLSNNKVITVYIDDLDRGWQGKKDDIRRISALLNAIRDISNENIGIRFRVALRSDVYYLVRTSDESTDKIEGSVVWFSWDNHEILVLLIKRIETFFGRKVDEEFLLSQQQSKLSNYLHSVMEARFSGSGLWSNAPIYRVLMTLIRKRPRDLVKICTLAARHAHESKGNLIMTSDFKAVFEEYSQGRIQDTINEYKSELPDIERLIMGMKPSKRGRETALGYTYTTDSLIKKIKKIMEQGEFLFANGEQASPKQLAHFMYKINFLTARRGTSGEGIERKYFEENRYLSGGFADFGYDWEVHPAYRWALQPGSLGSIFRELELSSDNA
jgi:hypothetical protein